MLLLDFNSLVYRGFFAIPPLTTTRGELVNAVFGFASILLKALQEAPYEHIAVAQDLPVPTFRKEMDATYKATRRPMPDDLRPQFERCKEFLGKFGAPMYFEGDADDDDAVIEEKVARVKGTIQSMLNRGLKERKSIFW